VQMAKVAVCIVLALATFVACEVINVEDPYKSMSSKMPKSKSMSSKPKSMAMASMAKASMAKASMAKASMAKASMSMAAAMSMAASMSKASMSAANPKVSNIAVNCPAGLHAWPCKASTVKSSGPEAVSASNGEGASCLSGTGTCQDSSTKACTGGTYHSGACPGAAAIKCCVVSGSSNNNANIQSASWSGSGKGVDVSDLCPQSGFTCLKGQGYKYAVVRAWRSSGTWDPQCKQNIANAIAAGMDPVDVYMFPRPKGASGVSQATSLWNNLKSTQFSGTVWFDVEQESPYWSTQSANQKFFNDVVTTLQGLGANVGIYTSKSQWTEIMGSSFSGGSKLPLWYSHYDNVASFSDFSQSAIGPYGGWSRPRIKQYMGDKSACSCNTDFNWSP